MIGPALQIDVWFSCLFVPFSVPHLDRWRDPRQSSSSLSVLP